MYKLTSEEFGIPEFVKEDGSNRFPNFGASEHIVMLVKVIQFSLKWNPIFNTKMLVCINRVFKKSY